jgi:predicted nucleotidyltransferase
MNTARWIELNKALDDISSTLITQYQPEKIILFGSMTNNEVERWSDIDLVIIKDTPLPFLQRLKEVALLCYAPVGVDFLVYTPAEFDQMITEQNPFILDEVIRKGTLLYERQPAPSMA